MSIPKFLNKLVPELNYWINRTLFNNALNKNAVHCPTKMSDYWRSTDSIIELIFNETADPSGETYDDGYHFIWKYRTINIKKLYYYEPMLFKRIQVYYNSTWIYVPKDDEKYKDIINLVDSQITLSDSYEYPYGIKPTKYVNYSSHIVTSGSDQVHYDDPGFNPESESEDDPTVIKEAENVFDLTEEELKMCEYLYKYRIGKYDEIPSWNCNYWEELESPLSKWVFVYLQCYLRDIYLPERLKTICDKTDGCFRCLCEKHLQDRVYEYICKMNMTLEEKINSGGGNDYRTFTPFTLRNSVFLQKKRITEDDVASQCIFVESIDKIPNDKSCFEFILDGKKLKQSVDYTVENIDSESRKKFIVKVDKKIDLVEDQKYQFMYNYIYHKNPISGINEIDQK